MKTRNWHAVNSHFRKAGPMKDKKKEESKKKCREKEISDFFNELDKDGYTTGEKNGKDRGSRK